MGKAKIVLINPKKKKMERYLNIPTKNREEKYIDPYTFCIIAIMRLYFIQITRLNSEKAISINYMEGLEWVMNYYTKVV